MDPQSQATYERHSEGHPQYSPGPGNTVPGSEYLPYSPVGLSIQVDIESVADMRVATDPEHVRRIDTESRPVIEIPN